jgi:hypothetical protein
MVRPLSYTPEKGPVITLRDLSEFVAEAYAKGFPDSATPRVMGALGGMSMSHGPLASRLTLVPGEVSDE